MKSLSHATVLNSACAPCFQSCARRDRVETQFATSSSPPGGAAALAPRTPSVCRVRTHACSSVLRAGTDALRGRVSARSRFPSASARIPCRCALAACIRRLLLYTRELSTALPPSPLARRSRGSQDTFPARGFASRTAQAWSARQVPPFLLHPPRPAAKYHRI